MPIPAVRRQKRTASKGRLFEDDVLCAPCLVRHEIALFEIAARAERALTGPREDDGAHVGIALETVEAREQVFAHRGVHRVHLLGPVHDDRHHVAIRRALDEQVAIAHL